ncbi:ATP-binding protein [Leptospira ilyithenensis]|uniref:ATP-binding protein n=1 Tax=Leptospira ilyithenensis TaxID=2484901 RepID=A0A4R9LNM4_9LEPT|nr:ATP-binding protein [Leptospira ilyithenensis]TGN08269.1 ATP-binding protein [Leptospira ilyithenensis]
MFPQLAEVTSLHLEKRGASPIQVEIGIKKGLPLFHLLGNASLGMKESRDRIRMAMEASGFSFPMDTIVVNLSPSHLAKKCAFLDLAIAIGILKATGQAKCSFPENTIILGSLNLNGNVIGEKDLLPLLWFRNFSETDTVILPGSLRGAIIPQGNYIFLESLSDLSFPFTVEKTAKNKFPVIQESEESWSSVFLSDSQSVALHQLCIAALGRHHTLLIGNPGEGKTMLARMMSSLLPSWTKEETESIFKGNLGSILQGQGLEVGKRPFRSPHHTCTEQSLVGGGTPIQPGEISLAHGGILFLDELGEFKEKSIESLREPMEEKKIHITRVNGKEILPADCMILGAINPCPCGNYGGKNYCKCSHLRIRTYLRKLSGPFLDRICLVISLFANDEKRKVQIKEKDMKRQLEESFQFRQIRMAKANTKKESNFIEEDLLEEYCKKYKIKNFSFRKRRDWMSLSRTVADWNQSSEIEGKHFLEAFEMISSGSWLQEIC